MSGSARKATKVSKEMIDLCESIIYAREPAEAVKEHKTLIDNITASEVISVVDELVNMNLPMPELKKGINKLLNLFYKALNEADTIALPKDGFLDYLQRNNSEMEVRLNKLRPHIRQLNDEQDNNGVKKSLLMGFKELDVFDEHYVIKENILFPAIERLWPDFSCVQLMWSFHDDIRKYRKKIIAMLEGNGWDIQKFNSLSGDLFFAMLAIKFREEKILFPEILRSFPKRDLNKMMDDAAEFSFPYIQPEIKRKKKAKADDTGLKGINLDTGVISVKQIKMIFNHLPVDITFVDENNKVAYFSTPQKRIFPRAKSIIGRDVRNCHPPESVQIVEKIIEEFRNGNHEEASFWLNLGKDKLLIQYFAVRDSQGRYKGVVEVSQEISEIQKLEGEQRLLDWE